MGYDGRQHLELLSGSLPCQVQLAILLHKRMCQSLTKQVTCTSERKRKEEEEEGRKERMRKREVQREERMRKREVQRGSEAGS